MTQSWIVVVPPLIVITLAAVTRRFLASLCVGIVAASLIVQNFQVMPTLSYMMSRFLRTTELANLFSWQAFLSSSTLFLCLFLILLGVLIVMIQRSGAAYAYSSFIIERIKTSKGIQGSSILLSSLFFIDDYFSSLTVGAVMQPITDRFAIARVKLALLVNVVAGPFAVVIPLSSWVAYVVGQLRSTGVSVTATKTTIVCVDPLYLYVASIPFMLYALIAIASICYMVWRNTSYGIVATHEQIAQKTSNLFGGKTPVVRRTQQSTVTHGHISDFIVPLMLLFVLAVGWILWTGQWWLMGGDNSFFDALQHSNIFASLCAGAAITVVVTTLLYLARRLLVITDLGGIFKEGSVLLGRSIMMLWLIWTLSGILSSDLQTGTYLAGLMTGYMSPVFLPALFFGMAALTAVLMGTAWGTMGMLIPLAIRMLPAIVHMSVPLDIVSVPLLIPVIGAIVSGSLVGNHMSPVADIMLMSATSAGAYHLDLVKAQISFAIPTFCSSLLAFVAVGVLIGKYGVAFSALMALAIGFVCNVIIMQFLHWLWGRLRR